MLYARYVCMLCTHECYVLILYMHVYVYADYVCSVCMYVCMRVCYVMCVYGVVYVCSVCTLSMYARYAR